jgi:hypothetical protein
MYNLSYSFTTTQDCMVAKTITKELIYSLLNFFKIFFEANIFPLSSTYIHSR